MKKVIACVTSLAVLAGCAAKSDSVVAVYQSPSKYTALSCSEIASELDRVRTNVVQLAERQDNARVRDQVAMGVGLVLFWPALFVLAAGDKEDELGLIKGEYEALQAASEKRNCAADAPDANITAVSLAHAAVRPARAVDGYANLPAGAPAPYEGVRLSSYTAADMQWFCSQSWNERISPEGRTEYNPCNMPQMFMR